MAESSWRGVQGPDLTGPQKAGCRTVDTSKCREKLSDAFLCDIQAKGKHSDFFSFV